MDMIRSNKKLHDRLRKFYGKTIGFWRLKEYYAKNMGFYNGIKRLYLSNKKEGEVIIANAIKSNKPFMFARYGSTEFRNLFYNEMNSLYLFSGFFPNNKNLLKEFRKTYLESSKEINILAIWNYKNQFFNKIKLMRKLPNIKNIVPIDVIGSTNHLWIKELKGKKVLVIHPFEETIKEQDEKRSQLGILPQLKSLHIIKAVQTLRENKDNRFNNWFEALEYMKKEIDKKDFDIAILGCGAYGFPLAAYIKSKGKQALHLGGCTQLLFGIIGNRWERGESKNINKYWVRPLPEDHPKGYRDQENGSYW